MAGQVTVEGESRVYRRQADSGLFCTYNFCPFCGSTVFYVIDARPGKVSVPVGGFGHTAGFQPAAAVYDDRREPWLMIKPTGGLEVEEPA